MDRGPVSDRPSSHIDGQRLSPSLPPQFWSTFSPPGSRNQFYPSEPAVDEATLAQRAAAFRQLHGNPRTPPRKHQRQAKSIGSSSLSSQPVIVRTHTPQTSPSGANPSASAGRPGMAQNARLPPVNDFTIDGILKAIQPDIQVTLDEIAKICGRSRLSLANEYDSHMPPQGEIRASGRIPFDHILLPVEEASSSNERLAGEMPGIVGDDYSLDDRPDLDAPHGHGYGILESLRAAHRYQVEPSSSWGDGSSMQVDHDIPRPSSVDNSALPILPHPIIEPPLLRDRATRSHSTNWTPLRTERRPVTIRPGEVLTSQPIVSELRLDAQYGHGRISTSSHGARAHNGFDYEDGAYVEYPDFSSTPYLTSTTDAPYHTSSLRQRIQNLSILHEAQNWLSWMNGTYGSWNEAEYQSAETNLRAILERHTIIDDPMVAEEGY
jgi:hypothetical protein